MIVQVIETGPEGNNKKLCNLLYRLNNIKFNNINYDLRFINYKEYLQKRNDMLGEDTMDSIYNSIINILRLQEPEYIITYSYKNIQEIKNYNKFIDRFHRKKNKFWDIFIKKIFIIDYSLCSIISDFIYS